MVFSIKSSLQVDWCWTTVEDFGCRPVGKLTLLDWIKASQQTPVQNPCWVPSSPSAFWPAAVWHVLGARCLHVGVEAYCCSSREKQEVHTVSGRMDDGSGSSLRTQLSQKSPLQFLHCFCGRKSRISASNETKICQVMLWGWKKRDCGILDCCRPAWQSVFSII